MSGLASCRIPWQPETDCRIERDRPDCGSILRVHPENLLEPFVAAHSKSYLATGLAIAASRQRRRVRFTTAAAVDSFHCDSSIARHFRRAFE
jgi:hypothetical protein